MDNELLNKLWKRKLVEIVTQTKNQEIKYTGIVKKVTGKLYVTLNLENRRDKEILFLGEKEGF